MATILGEHTTCDGHNVKCLFGKQKLILHFLDVPDIDDKLEVIALTEQRLLDEAASSFVELETDNGILEW